MCGLAILAADLRSVLVSGLIVKTPGDEIVILKH